MTNLCATIACQYTVGTSRRSEIVLRSQSPRKNHYALFVYPLFKRAQWSTHIGVLAVRNALSTSANSMTSSVRPSPDPLLKKKRRPQPYWGESFSSKTKGPGEQGAAGYSFSPGPFVLLLRVLEMLLRLQMHWIIGFGGSQPYSWGEFQEKGSLGNFPEFPAESPSCTPGKEKNQ